MKRIMSFDGGGIRGVFSLQIASALKRSGGKNSAGATWCSRM